MKNYKLQVSFQKDNIKINQVLQSQTQGKQKLTLFNITTH